MTWLQVTLAAIKWNLLQLETIPGWVGWGIAMPSTGFVVVTVMAEDFIGISVPTGGGVFSGCSMVVDVEVGRSVVVGGSSLKVPITQYESSMFKLGQLIPGFKATNSPSDSPQPLAKLSQVEPLSGDVENAQSTPRRT